MVFSTLIKTLVLPPTILIILLLVGLLSYRRWRWFARCCVWGSVLSFWVLALPVFSDYLHRQLETPFVTSSEQQQALLKAKSAPDGIEAIVVLGAGRHYQAQEYGGEDTLSHSALWRLRYGGHLAKRWDLPVIVSGGSVRSFDRISEAEMGVSFLQNELGVVTAWAEGQSRNTWENAQLTKKLLDEKGIQRVALVTHAYHMPRSMMVFSKAGVDAIPMPTGFQSNQSNTAFWLNWLPSASAFQSSHTALHEYLGLLFYQFK